MLGYLLRQNPGASSDLVFEAIDVYGKILQREPNDPTALVMMADVSFDQKAFTKALDFYERYLAIDPKDLGARARYASTLTFLGRYDDSISELGKVLESDPNNFPAMAYLAITYAQKGETSKAKAVGADALNLAPSDDARARFASFVSSLGDADKDVAQVKPRDSQVEPRESQVEQKGETGINGFIQSIKANPVAGVKFKSYEYAPNGTITLKFADFPMAQMPPFAKEKFFTGLKQALIKNGLRDVREIAFIDAATGEVMDRVGVGGE
jgi:tetratricopeptide (TPR) repeat protein